MAERTAPYREAMRLALIRRHPRLPSRHRVDLLTPAEMRSVAFWVRAGLARADAILIATDPAMHRWRAA